MAHGRIIRPEIMPARDRKQADLAVSENEQVGGDGSLRSEKGAAPCVRRLIFTVFTKQEIPVPVMPSQASADACHFQARLLAPVAAYRPYTKTELFFQAATLCFKF